MNAIPIERLLHRRSDLSTFLVHLTRGTSGADRTNLLSILGERAIEARNAYGMAKRLDRHLKDTAATQRVVCFTETPLEHAWMMTESIENRSIRFSPYGLVFTKTTARKKRCNPVWYLDITPGHNWLTNPVNDMVKAAKQAARIASNQYDADLLASQPIFHVTPFIEQMGPTNAARKEFWWEREWRHAGDFRFTQSQVVALLAPTDQHEALRTEIRALGGSWAKRVPPLLDPIWGQERMIGALSGIDEDQLGPFPGA